jgi:hypothetical protein
MELRTYTLASSDALHRYTDQFWPRHRRSLDKFGITVHGVWVNTSAGEPQVIALVEYPPGSDPARLADAYRHSRDFIEDHAHFNASLIASARTATLEAISWH